jgi:hypothetical protein
LEQKSCRLFALCPGNQRITQTVGLFIVVTWWIVSQVNNGRNGHEQQTTTRRSSRAATGSTVPPPLLARIDGPLGGAKRQRPQSE